MGVQIWTREQVGARILAGETLVVLGDKLIRVPDSWLNSHPGGTLAILHFVGRDASDEVEAFHSEETLRRMRGYQIGVVQTGKDGWEPLVPPVMSGWVRRVGPDGKGHWHNEASAVQSEDPSRIMLIGADSAQSLAGPTLDTLQPAPSTLMPQLSSRHSAAYKELHKRVKEAGLYQARYITGYGPEVLRYTLLAAVCAIAYSKGWLIISAISLGLLWHQLTFTAHDLGHLGVTHNWTTDRLFAIFITDLVGGISIGWWANNHNTHHCNDPDIQHLPFFAISPVFFNSLWSSYYKRVMTFDFFSKLFISVQHKLFYVILALARFNLYVNSYAYLAKTAFEAPRAKGGRWWWWSEVFALTLFYCWYGAVLQGCGSWTNILTYLLISNIVASPVHVQIVLSHFSRSTEDLGVGESFAARQLRTTVDVICPPSIEFIHGGLHLQVTHHMFPRLPRHNLRAASVLVKEFAEEQGLEYAEFGFVDGNSEVRGVLRDVAHQVKIVGMVADSNIREHMHSE
ncbi:fatty acid desaturase-domain-containing protein [Cytidiella melzeri]|nr:fatty acid desaturase-domain-containing protein [Cytidiella melzeri]